CRPSTLRGVGGLPNLSCLCLLCSDTIPWQISASSMLIRKIIANYRNIKIMGLSDSILSAVSGKSDASGEAAPLIGILSGILAQSGQGNTFSSWVSMGENQPV